MSASQAHSVLRIGTFNAEAHWQPKGRPAILPSVTDPCALDIVASLDELLVPWQHPGGTLLTMLPPETAQLVYLQELGIRFRSCALFAGFDDWRRAGKPRCTYEVATSRDREDVADLGGKRFAPYAVTENFRALAEAWGQEEVWPDPDVVAKVNSKVFSTHLNRLFLPDAQVAVVHSLAELDRFAGSLSSERFLLKDPYGVSGKGHFLVKDRAGFTRIKKFLAALMETGVELELVVEVMLDKSVDFSCHCEISRAGEIRMRGVQVLYNDGFRYVGSASPGAVLIARLEQDGYFERLLPYLRAVREEGYWGPVCVDSMRLGDGSIWPVVEINARESMGGIAKAISDYLSMDQVRGALTVLTFSTAKMLPYDELLASLARNGLLWQRGKPRGILPISSTSLYVTHEPGVDTHKKGRWYAMLIGESVAEQTAVYDQWLSLCEEQFRWRRHTLPYRPQGTVWCC